MSQAIVKEVISKLMLEWSAKGGDMAKAYDAVFGIGAYQKLKDDVYDEINAKIITITKQGE